MHYLKANLCLNIAPPITSQYQIERLFNQMQMQILHLSRIWLPLTTLQLHITHGLQLPSFTALQHTHSHPTLHQSHSCHQSLINPDCFTTPAPHSHTHTHISSTLPCTHREVLFFAPADILSGPPVFCFPGLPTRL